MRSFLVWLLLLGALSSCTLQRRHYRPGFAVFRSGDCKKAARDIIFTGERAVSSLRATHVQTATKKTFSEPILKEKKEHKVIKNPLPPVSSLQKIIQRGKPTFKQRATSFYASVTINRVPKAGFRMFIIGLIFFGGALFCFFNFSALVYVTAALLIIAFVFSLVSLITSASARKDKINNSKGWLAMSLITLLLDILEIAAIAVFFIALF